MSCTPYAGDYGTVYTLTFEDCDGSARDLTGLTVTFVFQQPNGVLTTVTATADPDQVANKGVATYTVTQWDGVQDTPGQMILQGRATDDATVRVTAKAVAILVGEPIDWSV